jgi:hypothetical protein
MARASSARLRSALRAVTMRAIAGWTGRKPTPPSRREFKVSCVRPWHYRLSKPTIRRYRAGAQSDNPPFLKRRERIIEDMRKAGVPEG